MRATLFKDVHKILPALSTFFLPIWVKLDERGLHIVTCSSYEFTEHRYSKAFLSRCLPLICPHFYIFLPTWIKFGIGAAYRNLFAFVRFVTLFPVKTCTLHRGVDGFLCNVSYFLSDFGEFWHCLKRCSGFVVNFLKSGAGNALLSQ